MWEAGGEGGGVQGRRVQGEGCKVCREGVEGL